MRFIDIIQVLSSLTMGEGIIIVMLLIALIKLGVIMARVKVQR